MHLDDLDPVMSYLFISLGHAAIMACDAGMTREHFIQLCQGMWETMEINGLQGFRSIIEGKMQKDVDAALALAEKETT